MSGDAGGWSTIESDAVTSSLTLFKEDWVNSFTGCFHLID